MFIKQKLLTKNEWSRPVRKNDMKPIKAIVLHWIADPKGSPTSVFNWFENRKKGKNGYGSAHFCIGVDGEALQFLPQEEMAYHVGSKTYTKEGLAISSYPNNSTLGIEMCHLDWEGHYSDETLEKTKLLTALLLKEYNLTPADISTHHIIVGWKDCPRWFTDHPEDFETFKEDVKTTLQKGIKGKVTKSSVVIADENGNKTGKIGLGWEVELIGIKNGFFKVKHNDKIGYCNNKYIEGLC